MCKEDPHWCWGWLFVGDARGLENIFGFSGHCCAEMASGIMPGCGKNTYFVRCLDIQWMGSDMWFLGDRTRLGRTEY